MLSVAKDGRCGHGGEACCMSGTLNAKAVTGASFCNCVEVIGRMVLLNEQVFDCRSWRIVSYNVQTTLQETDER